MAGVKAEKEHQKVAEVRKEAKKKVDAAVKKVQKKKDHVHETRAGKVARFEKK